MFVDAILTLLKAGDHLGAPSWEQVDGGLRILVPAPAAAHLTPRAGRWQLVLGDGLAQVDIGPFDRPELVIHDTSAALLEVGEGLTRTDRVRAFAFVTGALFFAQTTGNVLVEAKSAELLGDWLIAQGDIEQGFELISRLAAPAYLQFGDSDHARELGALVEKSSRRYDFEDAEPDSGAVLEQATAELLSGDLLPIIADSQSFGFERSAEEGPVFSLRVGDDAHLARLVPHTYGWLLFTFSLPTGVRCRIVGLPGGDPEDVVKRTSTALARIAVDDLEASRLDDAEVWARAAYEIAREVVATSELGQAAEVVAQVMLAAGRDAEADPFLRTARTVATNRSDLAAELDASTAERPPHVRADEGPQAEPLGRS